MRTEQTRWRGWLRVSLFGIPILIGVQDHLVMAQTTPPATVANSAADALAEGKKSLTAGELSRAIEFFTKALSSESAEVRADAQEFLGLAHERAGHLAHARAEYETFLKQYPKGSAAERVRQRLAGVMAAMESGATAELAARKKVKLASKAASPPPPAKQISQLTVSGGKKNLEAAKPQGWKWETSGSVGQSYYRDDGFADSSLLHGRLGHHDVLQSDIVSFGDVTVHGEKGDSEIEVRVSSDNKTGLEFSHDNETDLTSAYVDMRDRLSGLSARVGRQYRSGGGVFGRFDGALMGYQLNDQVLLQAVTGSPVYYGDDGFFSTDRYFYGASVDLTSHNKAWAGTLYALEQDVNSTVDRRAIGAELRYTGKDFYAYSGIDYDVHFGEINNLYLSGSWTARDDLTLYADFDYRRSPFLLTSNALMGQPVDTLSDLFDLFGAHETEALAVDRTATATTATLGLTYTLSDLWQLNLEGTAADYSGTPASGGVDKIPDPGVEYYLSLNLNGAGIFKDNDYLSLGLRFLDSSYYASYITDLSLRYPLNDELRLIPRLRLAYRDGKQSVADQLLVMPSLGVNYRLDDHWSLESEAAVLWEDNHAASGHDQNTDVRLAFGYRYQF